MADDGGPQRAVDRLRRSSTYCAKVEERALAVYYVLPATQADFRRRLGRNTEAASACEEAAALASTALSAGS